MKQQIYKGRLYIRYKTLHDAMEEYSIPIDVIRNPVILKHKDIVEHRKDAVNLLLNPGYIWYGIKKNNRK